MATTAKKNREWQGRLIKAIITFLSWLPLPVARFLAVVYAHILYWLPNRTKQVTFINLKTVYTELSTGEIKALLKRNLIESSKTFAELGATWLWSKEKLLPLIKDISGKEYLDEAMKNGKGVIVIAPHIGNWELIGPYLSIQYPCTFLYRPPNVAGVEKFMVESRERFGAKLAPTDARGVRTLIKALNQNELTAILPDQDPGKTGGVYAPFFNRPARTMTLLSKLVQKTECATVCVVLKRLPGLNAGFHLKFLPTPEGIDSADVDVATRALNKAVENCIEVAPEQYLWSYKRYRKPPAGVTDIYKQK